MKLIELSLLERVLPFSDFYEVSVLCVEDEGLASCRLPQEIGFLTNAIALRLSGNNIASDQVADIWLTYPQSWWINLSRNALDKLSNAQLPSALGSLDLTTNRFDIDELPFMSHSHILRLQITFPADSPQDYLKHLCRYIVSLPHCWVLNGHFINHQDRVKAEAVMGAGQINTTNHNLSTWMQTRGEREASILRIINKLSLRNEGTDHQRLDLLLEDYLQEAYCFNNYVREIKAKQSNTKLRPMPAVFNIHQFLVLPHRFKLDLSVILTATVLFDLPSELLLDTLNIVMPFHLDKEDLQNILLMPAFARTALVSILRRAARKEFRQLESFGRMKKKHPSRITGTGGRVSVPPFAFTGYESNEDFIFLRSVKDFFDDQLNSNTPQSDLLPLEDSPPFSELEREILSKLADCPTKLSSYKTDRVFAEEQDVKNFVGWVSFTARHASFLLNKSSLCPSLVRPPTNKTDQSLYWRLLPLLHAAGMTLKDLEILPPNCPGAGRVGEAGQLMGDLTASKSRRSAAERQARNLLGSGYLPFGAGLPRASIQSLAWRSEEKEGTGEETGRSYQKPWLEEKNSEQTRGREIFLTEGGEEDKILLSPSPPHLPKPLTPVYRLSTDSTFSLQSALLGDFAPLRGVRPSSLPVPSSPHPSSSRPPAPSPPNRSKSSSLQDFPPQFRPHSRSKSTEDLRMWHPLPSLLSSPPPSPPPSPPHSPVHLSLSPSFLPAPAPPLLPEADDGSDPLPRSVSISLPSVDGRDGPEMDDLLLTPMGGSRVPTPLHPEDSKQKAAEPSAIDEPKPTPQHLPLLSPKPITAYTADTLWSQHFLLAPQQAIQAYNESFRGLGFLGSEEGGLGDYWRGLQAPPVLLVENTPFAQRVSRAGGKREAPSLPPTVQEASEEEREREEEKRAQESPSAWPLGMSVEREGGDGISIDDSIAFSRASEGRLQQQQERAEQTHLAPLVENNRGKEKRESIRAKRASEEKDVRAMQADLLRSMGTVRNVRALEQFNRKLQDMKFGSALDSLSPATHPFSPSEGSFMSARENRQGEGEGEETESVFLTNVNALGYNEEEDLVSNLEADEDQLSSNSSASPLPFMRKAKTYHPPPRQAFSPSKAMAMRKACSYEQIFSFKDWTDEAVVSTSGKALAATFRPQFPKYTYFVDPAHNLNPTDYNNARLADSAEQMHTTAHRSAEYKLSSSYPVRLQCASTRSTNEIPVRKSLQVKEKYEDPALSTHNMDVLRSNKFLKQMMVKAHGISFKHIDTAAQKAPGGKPEGGEGEVSSGTSVVSANTFENTSMIYKAYSPQVMSQSGEIDTPALKNIQRSLTFLRDPKSIRTLEHGSEEGSWKGSFESTTSFLAPSVVPLEVPAPKATKSFILSPLAMPVTYSASAKHHKAATHKLALNRSFRVTLPSLSKSASLPPGHAKNFILYKDM